VPPNQGRFFQSSEISFENSAERKLRRRILRHRRCETRHFPREFGFPERLALRFATASNFRLGSPLQPVQLEAGLSANFGRKGPQVVARGSQKFQWLDMRRLNMRRHGTAYTNFCISAKGERLRLKCHTGGQRRCVA
jgi:hypothetical protein